jgi:hypothetical protein
MYASLRVENPGKGEMKVTGMNLSLRGGEAMSAGPVCPPGHRCCVGAYTQPDPKKPTDSARSSWGLELRKQ